MHLPSSSVSGREEEAGGNQLAFPEYFLWTSGMYHVHAAIVPKKGIGPILRTLRLEVVEWASQTNLMLKSMMDDRCCGWPRSSGVKVPGANPRSEVYKLGRLVNLFVPWFFIYKRTILVTTLQGNSSTKWDNNMKLAPVSGKWEVHFFFLSVVILTSN